MASEYFPRHPGRASAKLTQRRASSSPPPKPAFVIVFIGFIAREPLLILARQRFVWRTPNPRTPAAVRWLLVESAILAVSFALLARGVPLVPLGVFAAFGGVFTVIAVAVFIKNHQRSRAFQIVSAAALGSTAPFVAVVALGHIPGWIWPLWALLSLHGLTSILTVHARLALRTGRMPTAFELYAGLALQLLGAGLIGGRLALVPLFSAAANAFELYRLSGTLDEPFRRVGFRNLGVSIVFTILLIACLWPGRLS
ncbi:MAG: hypothetical protein FJW38_07800 [Acidobacteria bacterium]|nr:hypothetical protein [Acidobacteriota bacterium]